MTQLILFNKPFGVLSQFSGDQPGKTLASFITTKGVYPAGRLDKDSEGLLLLTDSGKVQHNISHPDFKMQKTYWVQMEGNISLAAINQLRSGVLLKDGLTKPAQVKKIDVPKLWPRDPPIRERKQIATSWIELGIVEGKNRQIRRMTAATGFPTLRLIRQQIGHWKLGVLQPGQWRSICLD